MERRQGTWSRLGWTVAALLVLFVAYVAGRAAGILLDLNPYATEVAATTLAVALLAWAAARGRDRRNTGPLLSRPPR